MYKGPDVQLWVIFTIVRAANNLSTAFGKDKTEISKYPTLNRNELLGDSAIHINTHKHGSLTVEIPVKVTS